VRVYLGSDHAGFELKARLIEWLVSAGYEPVDCGPHAHVQDDDYPPYVMRAAHGVAGDPGSLGIVIGGSGNGEQIAANKIPGIRAALAFARQTAQLAPLPDPRSQVGSSAQRRPLGLHSLADSGVSRDGCGGSARR
jgi:ribose 5-phosphate isomerase B